MKRFIFSLGRMLSYKEQLQTAEKNKLAQLMLQKHKLEDLIDSLKQESVRVSAQLQKAAQSGVSALEISTYNFRIQNNRTYVEQLIKELRMVDAAVELQVKAVLAATQEVEGLLKLKDKQYEEYQQEERKSEQLIVSEFISSKLTRERNSD